MRMNVKKSLYRTFLGFKKDTEKTSIEKTMRSTEMVVTSASLIP